MSISDLKAIVAAPVQPLEAGPSSRWAGIQKELGCPLPTDLRDFGLNYGSGTFAEIGLHVFNPFSASYRQQVDEQSMVWRSLKAAEGDNEVPYDVFPNRPGLLPWGAQESGAGLFWLTNGKPDDWPVVVRGHEESRFQQFDTPLLQFLVGVFRGIIRLPQVWTSSTFKRKRARMFQTREVGPRLPGKSVHDLYVENGMATGFWIAHQIFQGVTDNFRVVSVGGQTSGPLSGAATNGEDMPVLLDVYVNGVLTEHNVKFDIASDPGFRIVPPPDWWKQ